MSIRHHPQTTPTPHDVFDLLLAEMDNLAQAKVVLSARRRRLGCRWGMWTDAQSSCAGRVI